MPRRAKLQGRDLTVASAKKSCRFAKEPKYNSFELSTRLPHRRVLRSIANERATVIRARQRLS